MKEYSHLAETIEILKGSLTSISSSSFFRNVGIEFPTREADQPYLAIFAALFHSLLHIPWVSNKEDNKCTRHIVSLVNKDT